MREAKHAVAEQGAQQLAACWSPISISSLAYLLSREREGRGGARNRVLVLPRNRCYQ